MDRRTAPDPIKMKYFAVHFDGLKDSTPEERLNELLEKGRKAALAFPAKYQGIRDWFARYDQLALLSFSFYYFLLSPAGYDEEAVTGRLEFPPYYLELLQAFALTLPRTCNGQPFSAEVPKFKNDLKEIGELNLLKYYNFPPSMTSIDDLHLEQLRTNMMTHTTAVRNWAYEHQMKDVIFSLAVKIKEPFLRIHRFDPVVFLELIFRMCEVIEERVNEHRANTVEIMRPKTYTEVIEAYEKYFPVVKSTPQQMEFLWKKSGEKLKNLQGFLLMHSDMRLPELLTFHYKDLEMYSFGKLTAAQLKEVFKHISLSFNELAGHNAEHFLLGNPVHEKPFLHVDDDQVFSAQWAVMGHHSLGLLEKFCAVDEQLLEKYNQARADYLEDQVEALFKNNFPGAEIFAGSQWLGETDGKLYENDLLVIIDSFAIVVEAKSGRVSPPAKRGAQKRLFNTLQELIDEPSEQALRFIEHLKAHPNPLALGTKKGTKNKFDAAPLKFFIPLGVTLSHLGSLSTNLKQLIRARVTERTIDQLAPSISITDLKVVFDLLSLTAQKVHYLQRRREIESNFEYVGDEVDLLAWYLDKGFNFSPEEREFGLFNVILKSKELDNYIIGSANEEEVVKPELAMTKWWKDMLQRLDYKRMQHWLENSYILLNVPRDAQKDFEEMVETKRGQMLKNEAEFPHEFIILETSEKDRCYMLAGYLFHEHVAYERKEVMGDIIFDHMKGEAKGKLVIGMNIDKGHYPYSMYGCLLSSKLFDSQFSKMSVSTSEGTTE
jgi:hypothetical protein